MEGNHWYLERIFEFQQAVGRKNQAIAARVLEAIPALVEYPGNLSRASRDELLGIRGIGEGTVAFYERILKGEEIGAIIADVPSSSRPVRRRAPHEKEQKEWSGSWDNIVRRIEDN